MQLSSGNDFNAKSTVKPAVDGPLGSPFCGLHVPAGKAMLAQICAQNARCLRAIAQEC